MLVRPGFEPATFRSADRRSPNWANQAAMTRGILASGEAGKVRGYLGYGMVDTRRWARVRT